MVWNSETIILNYNGIASNDTMEVDICRAQFGTTRVDDKTKTMKKKKRKKFLTICTTNCKYDLVRQVAARFGMREVTEDSSWNLYWTDLSINIERAKDLKRYQKVNHFPGMIEICRKDLLARNLNRMLKLFPKEYNFFPKTWCFPSEYTDAVGYSKFKRSRTFIIKPDVGCQGRGIYLTKNLKNVKTNERLICQVYITRPFLIDGYKFDFRIYALITSCDPLRIYVYNDGLARFATNKYKEPTGENISNVFMHLTNYALNKHSQLYVDDDQVGSKRKISTLNKWLRVQEINVDKLWNRIDDVIIKTILAAHPVLKRSYDTCFAIPDRTYPCFELLGFDILVDWKLKPYLLEVNHSPSFHTDSKLDKEIKEGLLMDTFDILNLQQCDKRKIIEEDKRRVRERLLQGTTINDCTTITKLDNTDEGFSKQKQQCEWEDEHLGNFRQIHPNLNKEKYDMFLGHNFTSIHQNTVASRAREEITKTHRRQNGSIKLREKGNKRKFNVNKRNPLTSPIVSEKKSNFVDSGGSFEPGMINESEEKDRLLSLAQRDYLVKSYGLLEQIYMAMKKNGNLRKKDEKKYKGKRNFEEPLLDSL